MLNAESRVVQFVIKLADVGLTPFVAVCVLHSTPSSDALHSCYAACSPLSDLSEIPLNKFPCCMPVLCHALCPLCALYVPRPSLVSCTLPSNLCVLSVLSLSSILSLHTACRVSRKVHKQLSMLPNGSYMATNMPWCGRHGSCIIGIGSGL